MFFSFVSVITARKTRELHDLAVKKIHRDRSGVPFHRW